MKNVYKTLPDLSENIIVHLKASLKKFLKDSKEVIQWNIEEQNNIVAVIVHKKILSWLLQVLLNNLKLVLLD